MKIADIVEKNIAVYANEKEEFTHFLAYLSKRGYKWISGYKTNEWSPYGVYKHVCIYITQSGIRWCDISEVIKAGYDIISCNKLDDFKTWIQEIALENKRQREVALKAAKENIIEIELGGTIPLSALGFLNIKEITHIRVAGAGENENN